MMIILATIYAIIAIIYYWHNRKMGGVISGLICASLWLVTALLWCFGAVLVYMDNVHLKRIIKECDGE